MDSATVPDSKDYAFLGTKVMVRNVSASGNAMTADLYVRDPVGVEEDAVPSFISRLPFQVSPNPFASYATVPGRKWERFTLFDVSGRKVGVYPGDRIGEGLSPGVYFLKPEARDAKPMRLIKLR